MSVLLVLVCQGGESQEPAGPVSLVDTLKEKPLPQTRQGLAPEAAFGPSHTRAVRPVSVSSLSFDRGV